MISRSSAQNQPSPIPSLFSKRVMQTWDIKAVYEEEVFTMKISFEVEILKGFMVENSVRELDICQGANPIEELCALISSVVKNQMKTELFNLLPLQDSFEVFGTHVKILQSLNKKILLKWAAIPKMQMRKRKMIGQITAEMEFSSPKIPYSPISTASLSSNLDDFCDEIQDTKRLDTLMHASEKILAENEIKSCNIRRAELMESYKAIKAEFDRLGHKKQEAQHRLEAAEKALGQ